MATEKSCEITTGTYALTQNAIKQLMFEIQNRDIRTPPNRASFMYSGEN